MPRDDTCLLFVAACTDSVMLLSPQNPCCKLASQPRLMLLQCAMQDLDHQLQASAAEAVGSDHAQANFVLPHMQHKVAALSRADTPLQQGSN